MKEKEGESESESEEIMSGRVSVEKGEADFPGTLDTMGRILVPDYVREMLQLNRRKARVQVLMQVKEVFE